MRQNGGGYATIVEITSGERGNPIWNFWKFKEGRTSKYLEKFRQEKDGGCSLEVRQTPHIPPRI
jgi:hypothetical protein